jgi:hypothetical protein
MLRNPWIEPQAYALQLPADSRLAFGMAPLCAVSIYPEARVYGTGLKPGDTLDVRLAPYETVVLRLDRTTAPSDRLDASQAVCRQLAARILKREVSFERFAGDSDVLSADTTCLVGKADGGIRVDLDAEVTVDAAGAEFLILLEDKEAPVDPICRVRVDGKEVNLLSGGSETGWAASSIPRMERWLFLSACLPKGKSLINLNLLTRGGNPVVSAWVWTKKAGSVEGRDNPDALPQPEVISLDGMNLLKPVDVKAASTRTRSMERPVERIDGIFIDAMDPSLVRVMSGGLARNTCITKAPIVIAGRRYLRGLGVSGLSRIALSLDGKYRRFQSWVGLDSAVMGNYMDRSAVAIGIRVDGQKKWESGVIRNTDPAEPVRWVDIDVAGAKVLELEVVAQDSRGHFAQNLADWAEAKLLR